MSKNIEIPNNEWYDFETTSEWYDRIGKEKRLESEHCPYTSTSKCLHYRLSLEQFNLIKEDSVEKEQIKNHWKKIDS